MRYFELTDAPCAIAYTERGRVVWAKCSRAFPARVPAQMRVGIGAIAFDYHEGAAIDPNARVVPARSWLGTAARLDDTATLVEQAEVIPEPGWGGVLSLLWFVDPCVACSAANSGAA